ncbi:hypothetical protein [Bosea sp. PAMC 26642]|uniref:hypothetical protein n=1 Tax=Bosea sp. (strain PAMC 26642) TaxID=1792307 RepID=UPI00077021E3|nr:hypothetical protein [Bosea sp. PAMC 26642]AMJ60623.1 hypothetical protein AXW83_10270 [Bosea sp. PAMC 26642]
MTYVLNPTASLLASNAEQAATTASTGPTVWQRLFAAMVESRRRSAIRELRARSYLINEAEIVLGGFPQVALKNDAELPFNR